MTLRFNAPSVSRWAGLLCAFLCVNCGSDDGDDPKGDAGSSSGGSGSGGKGTGGSKPSVGGAVTVVPGAPHCGLDDAAAFCDQFDAPAAANGRAGELDVALWSGSRAQPQLPTRDGLAIGILPAKLEGCRADLPATVYPDQDALICDPTEAIPSNHLLLIAAAQNYGQTSLRIRQPFDFDGRTGKVVFDAEGYLQGSLLGWVSLAVTEDPISAPSFTTGGPMTQNDEGAQIPKNGFEIQFQDTCAGYKDPPVVGVRMLIVFKDYVATEIKSEDHVCPTTEQAHLNHFEVSVSPSTIEIYASDSSAGGGEFGDLQLLMSADVDLPMTRGYVTITSHNHATIKYSEGNSLDSWQARWDNVGFDGPKLTGTREYEIPDSLETGTDPQHVGEEVTNIGYRIADAADGPAQTMTFKGVDPEGMASARIALSCWYLKGDTTSSYLLQYRLNGGAWHDRALTAAEAGIVGGSTSQGQLAQMLDVPLEELMSGDNTLEIVSKNAPQNYPPVVSNVDLILSE